MILNKLMFSSQLIIISLLMMLLIKKFWSITEGIMFVTVSACIVMVIVWNTLSELCIIINQFKTVCVQVLCVLQTPVGDSSWCKIKKKTKKFYIIKEILLLKLIFPGALMYLNPATLLNNIRTRYYKEKIYVSNHLVLVS